MRALDTNVLVRLLMLDDEAQWQRVDALVREAERARTWKSKTLNG